MRKIRLISWFIYFIFHLQTYTLLGYKVILSPHIPKYTYQVLPILQHFQISVQKNLKQIFLSLIPSFFFASNPLVIFSNNSFLPFAILSLFHSCTYWLHFSSSLPSTPPVFLPVLTLSTLYSSSSSR